MMYETHQIPNSPVDHTSALRHAWFYGEMFFGNTHQHDRPGRRGNAGSSCVHVADAGVVELSTRHRSRRGWLQQLLRTRGAKYGPTDGPTVVRDACIDKPEEIGLIHIYIGSTLLTTTNERGVSLLKMSPRGRRFVWRLRIYALATKYRSDNGIFTLSCLLVL